MKGPKPSRVCFPSPIPRREWIDVNQHCHCFVLHRQLRCGATFIFLAQAAVMVSVFSVWFLNRTRNSAPPLVLESDVPEFVDPVINGEKIHDIVFPGGCLPSVPRPQARQ